MSDRVRVNIRTVADTAHIRNTTRGGRDIIIVPSATLPDDIVMNDILYPAAEIAKGFATLEGTPAPAGHPTANGQFVSAQEPMGINIGWCGAHNENVRQEKDANGRNRVKLDKVIDVEAAKRHPKGQEILNAIEAGDPIHTSTGLTLTRTKAQAEDYSYVASNMEFDHDAILVEEEGAGTPEQGVGMMVNKAVDQDGQEIEVINSEFEESAERRLDWAVEETARALEQMARVPMMEQIKAAILGMLPGMGAGGQRETTASNSEENAMDDKKLEELSGAVNALTETLSPENLGKVIGNAVSEAVKPLADHVAEQQANAKAAEDAEKATLVEKVVAGNVLTQEVAEATPIGTLKALAANAKPLKAAAINGATKDAGDDAAAANAKHLADFDLSAGVKKEA